MCNSKCVKGNDMHNDNLRHQDFGMSCLREWVFFFFLQKRKKTCLDSYQYFTSSTDWMCVTFFHYRDGVLRFIVLFVSGHRWLLYQLLLSLLFLKSFCSLTELFTMNQHAMYCTDILYSMAVYDETTLFDTLKEPSNVSYLFVFGSFETVH